MSSSLKRINLLSTTTRTSICKRFSFKKQNKNKTKNLLITNLFPKNSVELQKKENFNYIVTNKKINQKLQFTDFRQSKLLSKNNILSIARNRKVKFKKTKQKLATISHKHRQLCAIKIKKIKPLQNKTLVKSPSLTSSTKIVKKYKLSFYFKNSNKKIVVNSSNKLGNTNNFFRKNLLKKNKMFIVFFFKINIKVKALLNAQNRKLLNLRHSLNLTKLNQIITNILMQVFLTKNALSIHLKKLNSIVDVTRFPILLSYFRKVRIQAKLNYIKKLPIFKKLLKIKLKIKKDQQQLWRLRN